MFIARLRRVQSKKERDARFDARVSHARRLVLTSQTHRSKLSFE